MRGIIIENSGPLTTIQDKGRNGFRRYGVPASGAMDTFSMQAANILAGNPPGAPLLEATLTGPEIRFISACKVAVTGAPCEVTLNGSPVSQWRSIRAGRNAVLKTGTATAGARIYIAFSGGLAVSPAMGSSSTYLKGSFGGIKGRELRKGDIIPLEKSGSFLPGRRALPASLIPICTDEVTLDILPGIHFSLLGNSWKEFMTSRIFTVSPYIDRMGLRLLPDSATPGKTSGNTISCPIHYGAIQIPGDGNPVIMGADAQTIGGYPQFSNIITSDLDKVGQLRPGNRIRFNIVSYEIAVEKILQQVIRLESLK
ncbi:MAG: biotin-dependent carboxyltransferase family protein [Bacteroidales bacterium]|nr:biotin-dependent carboxyltransferase family protein [Bacteroidales bacterium]